jgi:hypothetical protein
MSSRAVVIGNMERYVPYHVSQVLGVPYRESEHGGFTLAVDTSQGVLGHVIDSWSVAGVTQPTYEALMVYEEDQAFLQYRTGQTFLTHMGSSASPDLMKDRQNLLTFLNPADWLTLNANEKQLLARAFLVGQTERREVWTTYFPELKDGALTQATIDEDDRRSLEHHKGMVKARTQRLIQAEALIYNSLSNENAKSVILAIQALKALYVDGLDHMLDYLNSANDYVGNGFVETAYVPLDGLGTLVELRDRIKVCLE